MKFNDIIKITQNECVACISLMYELPCQIDEDIYEYLKDFGRLLYSFKSIRLLHIRSSDSFEIEGKLGNNKIKFVIPKKFQNQKISEDKKLYFETLLSKWITKKLNMEVGL